MKIVYSLNYGAETVSWHPGYYSALDAKKELIKKDKDFDNPRLFKIEPCITDGEDFIEINEILSTQGENFEIYELLSSDKKIIKKMI